jgi:hypothetical protein
LAVIQAQSAVQVLTSWIRKSDKPQVVEDDLINALARLHKAAMVFSAPRPIPLLMPEAAEKLSHMSSIFSSLEEAQTYWDKRFRSHASALAKVYPDTINDHGPDYNPPSQGNVSRVKFDEERLLQLTNLEHCRSAFAPIWNHSNTLAGAENFQSAAILLLQSLYGTISFSAAAPNDECIYGTFMSEFQKMIWLIRSILERAEAIRVGRVTKEFSFSIENRLKKFIQRSGLSGRAKAARLHS